MDDTGTTLVKPVLWGDPPVEWEFLLPIGTVTLLLADIGGSTRLWEDDPAAMTGAVARLHEVVREAVGRHGGVRPEEQGEGDSFVAAFARASDAVRAAVDLQRALDDGPIRLRVGLHTGEVQLRDARNYVGPTINRAGRLRDAARPGQVVVSNATRELVADSASFKDLGTHRLRDLQRPEHVWQLGSESFPPLRSLDALPHNLPIQLTSFVGRSSQMVELRALAMDFRLLTLTGAGGCGKTRLATQLAADLLERFPDGVWMVDLWPISDPAAIEGAVADVLRTVDDGARPLGEAVAALIGDRSVLLLLDNCEHVVSACADLASRLLGSCPGLTILATSREPLGTPGEVAWRVPSMAMPTDEQPIALDALGSYEAVELFVDRAKRGSPRFEMTEANKDAIASLCRRLDGVPLAIELAAARVRVLTPEQIRDGLHDRFRLLTGGPRTVVPRQQTLEASVDWSHALLMDAERVALRRLAVFVGGFTLQAAESVCAGDGVERHHVLDLLSQLVDKSLVVADDDGAQARYRLLETIRQYAHDRLRECGEQDATTARHQSYYVDLSRPTVRRAYVWDDPMGPERGNVRAAFDFACRQADTEAMLVLASNLSRDAFRRNHRREAVEIVDVALAADDGPDELRAYVLHLRAYFLGTQFLGPPLGTSDAVIESASRSLAIARNIGDEWLIARALMTFGANLPQDERPAIVDEALVLARRVGDEDLLRLALHYAVERYLERQEVRRAEQVLDEMDAMTSSSHPERAVVVNLRSRVAQDGRADLRAARDLRQEAYALARAAGNFPLAQNALNAILFLSLLLGENEHALATADEADREFPDGFGGVIARAVVDLWVAWRNGDYAEVSRLVKRMGPPANPSSLAMLAAAAFLTGDREAGRQHLAAATAAGPEVANPGFGPLVPVVGSLVALKEGDAPRAEDLAHDALRVSASFRVPLGTAIALDRLGAVAADLQSFEEAARLFAAARAIRDRTGAVWLPFIDQSEGAIAATRAALDAEAFDAAWAEGEAMSVEDAVAYAQRGRGERKRPSSGWASLTPAELQVVRLVAEGLSNKQIGQRLYVETATVKTHLVHVYAKVGLSSRTELATEAVRRSL